MFLPNPVYPSNISSVAKANANPTNDGFVNHMDHPSPSFSTIQIPIYHLWDSDQHNKMRVELFWATLVIAIDECELPSGPSLRRIPSRSFLGTIQPFDIRIFLPRPNILKRLNPLISNRV